MSRGVDEENETAAHVFIHKMPPRGETVVDKQKGRNNMSSEGRLLFVYHIQTIDAKHLQSN